MLACEVLILYSGLQTTYSSEDAPVRKLPGNDLFVYYCKVGGLRGLSLAAAHLMPS